MKWMMRRWEGGAINSMGVGKCYGCSLKHDPKKAVHNENENGCDSSRAKDMKSNIMPQVK